MLQKCMSSCSGASLESTFCLPSAAACKHCPLLPPCSGDRRRLPSHHAAASLLRCLLAACQLVVELEPAVHRASLQLLAQLAHSFFMPLCLTALATLARIQVRRGT